MSKNTNIDAPPAMRRTGKKAAGCLLDGQTYDNIPEAYP